MIVFDVKCRVTAAIEAADAAGKRVTIAPGDYRLRGIEHLVRSAAGRSAATGTDFTLHALGEDGASYTVSAESLAHFIADDDVEVSI